MAFLVPWLGLAALLGMRVLWLAAYPMDSDEPQHAHVAWSLAQGAALYRDVFDNHGPLFGLLYSVVMRALGPRPDILWWLRLAVIPWYVIALAATWLLARRLYPRAVAGSAVLLVALMQVFFIKMGEFRTDDLWTALWLCALALAAYAGRKPWRWWLAGLCVGAALAVSQKTLPLLATALVAGAGVWPTRRPRLQRGWLGAALAAGLGSVLVPAVLVAWLVRQRDLAAAWYDLVAYGIAPNGGPSHAWRQACYAVLVVLVMTIVRRRRRLDHDDAARWRSFLGLQGLLYVLLIWVAWPLSTPQDFLPVIPPVLLYLTGAAARWRPLRANTAHQARLVGVLVALELVLLVRHAPPWRDALAVERSRLAVVLRCTEPSDTVLDAKSGAIFRPRPYYPVLESLALRRLEHGLMPDTIADAMVSHRTMVVVPGRLPPLAQAFVAHNYLAGTAGVYMAGVLLPATAAIQWIRIGVPGRYTLTDGSRGIRASMDGGPPATQWNLASGPHRLAGPATPDLVLTWSEAWTCGWRPALRRHP